MLRFVFLGGNGHARARLVPARRALSASGGSFELEEAVYPGFEDRPRSSSFDAFLDAVAASVVDLARGQRTVLYATGIGALFALCLRARGGPRVPLLMQGPVLWGLERRLTPRLSALGPARRAIAVAFASHFFQTHFVRRNFVVEPPDDVRKGFFDGYARCSALVDFFAWLTPALLRDLERRFTDDPAALDRIAIWWGERDRIVTPKELAWTTQALHVSWPIRTFAGWGHYPMIDDARRWVEWLPEGADEAERAIATPVAPAHIP